MNELIIKENVIGVESLEIMHKALIFQGFRYFPKICMIAYQYL